MNIFGDYITAHSVISIALLGISVGGILGFFTASRAPLKSMIWASLILPITILSTFVITITPMEVPLIASILFMLPFICGSTIITIVLTRAQSHLVYFIDLIGAALGALFVSTALSQFREESSLIFLSAFTFLVAGCFIISYPYRRLRTCLLVSISIGFLSFLSIGALNLRYDWLNLSRINILRTYPQAKVLFSKSSYVGRYDIIRTSPDHGSLIGPRFSYQFK